MKLEVILGEYAVARLKTLDGIPPLAPFSTLSVTDSEISLVALADRIPRDAEAVESGYAMIRFTGTLDFSLTGVISRASAVLARQEIGIFVISTYLTDYILIKARDLARAVEALKTDGYTFL